MSFSWFRTLLGAVSSLTIWAVPFTTVYSLVGLGCERGWDQSPVAGSNLLSVVLIVVTVPVLVLIAWIGWAGWRWQARAEGGGAEPGPARRVRFLGLLTLAIAAFA